MDPLKRRGDGLWGPMDLSTHCPFVAPPAFWEEIHGWYGTPGRHYHTLAHLEDFVQKWLLVPSWHEPAVTFLALLTHDAVYTVGARDNEVRSADLGAQWATRLWSDPKRAERVHHLVLSTADHTSVPTGDPDLDHFLDCDLSILGASPDAYDAYAAKVQAEYAPVAGPMYQPGRINFLKKLLTANHLFRSPWGQDLFEEAARRNIQRELTTLKPLG